MKALLATLIVIVGAYVLLGDSIERDPGAGSSTNTPISWADVPATAASAGTAGDVAYDANFFYVCTAASTWKRVPIAAW